MNIIKNVLENPIKCLGKTRLSFVPNKNTLTVIKNEFSCTNSRAIEIYKELRNKHIKALVL